MKGRNLSDLDWKPITGPDSEFLAYSAFDSNGKEFALAKNERTPDLMYCIQFGSMKVIPGWYKLVDDKIQRVS